MCWPIGSRARCATGLPFESHVAARVLVTSLAPSGVYSVKTTAVSALSLAIACTMPPNDLMGVFALIFRVGPTSKKVPSWPVGVPLLLAAGQVPFGQDQR